MAGGRRKVPGLARDWGESGRADMVALRVMYGTTNRIRGKFITGDHCNS